MVNSLMKNRKVEKVFLTVFGNVIYAMGVNLAIVPLHLYSGGFTGIAQLIRLLLIQVLHLPEIQGIDYMGIIYFLINVPFFFVAYKVMGKKFCITTLISVVMSSLCLSLIPVPAEPIIDDRLFAAIIGGLGSGTGAGMVLKAGSSQGGQDLLGVCLAKTNPDFKVGTIGIIISVAIYTICLFVYDIETVLYSIVFAVVTGLCINKVHTQNIKSQAMIFTKKEGVDKVLMKELNRGLTRWEGEGAYTNESSHVLVTVISKYEETHLKEVLADVDPEAFVILTEDARVLGNFQKKFTE